MNADGQAGAIPYGYALGQQAAADASEDVARPTGRQGGVGARPDVDTSIRRGNARKWTFGYQHATPLHSQTPRLHPGRLSRVKRATDQPLQLARVRGEHGVGAEKCRPVRDLGQGKQAVGVDDQPLSLGAQRQDLPAQTR